MAIREDQPCPLEGTTQDSAPSHPTLSPFAVEQVANVVLYSSDYYVKPVAMEETQ